ncbi:hypothetical protein PR202_ga24076 [Eleusine coracana subsp. coracana]|uniref:Uncharacterized protein n=1 Tax=Eleusine coracana subsp. coracana TaxID=191504 RepID=A0AAV5D6R0_ELECO|nr:hypothetical protein PR202_ga24076 [Eleusine coracana subsp. coracana]
MKLGYNTRPVGLPGRAREVARAVACRRGFRLPLLLAAAAPPRKLLRSQAGRQEAAPQRPDLGSIRPPLVGSVLRVQLRRKATPLIAGLAVAATALAGRYTIQAWQAYKARPIVPRMRKFYEGGFQPTMNRREAALILGVRFC